ncbi:cob(I)alamin adenosyltransferase [Spirochaetia bacterium]|nr:cob(I)alamin adenosyltransferase [Spirochaetia bacterium]
MSGLIHVYTGGGKGKTTAAVGLAVRASGRNKKVIFAQFLKTGKTGELEPLERLGVSVMRSTLDLGWTFKMDAPTKEKCRGEQLRILGEAETSLKNNDVFLLVLDEVLDAVQTGMLDEAVLIRLLENKPAETEVVITGRPVPVWLSEKADYVSEVKKIKHPFDKGIPARVGIEK